MNSFDKLILRFHDYFTNDGNACVALGLDKNLDNLPDLTEEGYYRELSDGQALLKDIKEFDRSGLTFDQKLDLDLAQLLVEQDIFNSNLKVGGQPLNEKMPTAAIEISDPIFTFFVNDPREPEARLNNILARIRQVPRYLNDSLESYSTPLARWVDMEIESIEELPEFFQNIVVWAKSVNYYKISELEEAVHLAVPASISYIDALKKLPTSTDFSIGEDQARELIRRNGIEMTLEEMKSKALTFLKENNQNIDSLRSELVRKYKLNKATTNEELQSFLNEKFKLVVNGDDFSSVLDYYKQEKNKILKFINQRELFPIVPDQDIIIIQTPKFMEPTIPAGAMMPPPAFRSGTKKSIVYLTLSHELMDEHSKLSVGMMLAHEGGHHWQYSNAYTHPSIVRRHGDFLEMSEGFATYLEGYMLDQGYMEEFTTEARFIMKRDFNRLGVRVLIDLYFMTGDKSYIDVGFVDCSKSLDPFLNAEKLLSSLTGFSHSRCQSELNWYSQASGYPCSYLVGNLLLNELKNEMRTKTKIKGIELDRLFHKMYLEQGSMPISFFRKVFKFHGLI